MVCLAYQAFLDLLAIQALLDLRDHQAHKDNTVLMPSLFVWR